MDKNNLTAMPVRRSASSPLSNVFTDFYHMVVKTTWPRFLASFAAVFLAINLLFGWLYFLQSNSIAGLQGIGFLEYFFFSVQTLATIGYGSMYPQSIYGHVLVTIESMVGLLGVGMFAALAFAKISLPRSRVVFSNTAVVGVFDGQPALMFRMANERNNRIIGAQVELSLFIQETTREGHGMRRIYDLHLVRDHTPMLALTWLVIHPIDEKSPLSKLNIEKLADSNFALVATISGLDETVSQTIHSNHIYTYEDIRWNHRFADLYQTNELGEKYIDQTLIHDTVELSLSGDS
jgi:inward rectifier potassium channel